MRVYGACDQSGIRVENGRGSRWMYTRDRNGVERDSSFEVTFRTWNPEVLPMRSARIAHSSRLAFLLTQFDKLLLKQDVDHREPSTTVHAQSTLSPGSLRASRAPNLGKTCLGLEPNCSCSPSPSSLQNRSPRRSRYDSENSSSSDSSSSGSRKKQRPPPDGGWGWMVVLASFAINLISDGVSLSFGVFLPDLTSYFAVGRGHAAWVASLFLSMPLLAGPIASWLTDRYGCRRVCIVGSIIASLGFVLSYFSNSLALLYVTFSFAGFGLALCYVTSVVIVAYYFEKKRCLATGLSVCGSGVGTFIFAPLTYMLVEKYTWRGTLLILAGFFLNMVASGALMRDLDVQQQQQDSDSDDEENHSVISSQWNSASHLEDGKRMYHSLLQLPTYLSNESPKLPVQVLTEMSSNEKGHLKSLLELYPNLWHDMLNQNDDPYLTVKSSPLFKTIPEHRVLENISTLFPIDKERKLKSAETIEFQSENSTVLPSDATTISNGKKETVLSLDPSTASNGVVRSSLACAAVSTKKSPSLRQTRQASIGPLPLFSRDRANSAAYLRNLRLQRGSLTYRGAMLNIKRYRLKASSCPNIYRNSMATINDHDSSPFEFFEDLKDVICDMMDVRLLTNFKYALFCFSNFLLNACVDNPYVYIPDHAASLPSIQEGAGAFIISVLGVLNTLGVVIVGYIGDKPWIDPSLLYAICTVIAGASVATIPLLHSYLPLAMASAIYGFTISANYTLVPEIVVNLISLDNFTGAYGLLLLIQGIAGLIGPPIAGWLYDISGSYNSTFYISGISILASGLLVIPVADFWTCSRGSRPVEDDTEQQREDQDPESKQNGATRLLNHSIMENQNRDNGSQPIVDQYKRTNGRNPKLGDVPHASPTACVSPALSISPTRVRFCLTPSPPPPPPPPPLTATRTTSSTPSETIPPETPTTSSARAVVPTSTTQNEERPAT